MEQVKWFRLCDEYFILHFKVSLTEYDNLGEVGKSVASLVRNNIKEVEQEKVWRIINNEKIFK